MERQGDGDMAAVTTVAAEAVSAGLSVWYVYSRVPMLRLGKRELGMDRRLLKDTLQYGFVTALQQSCQPVGKLLIQGAVNGLGVESNADGRSVFLFLASEEIAAGSRLEQDVIERGEQDVLEKERKAGRGL